MTTRLDPTAIAPKLEAQVPGSVRGADETALVVEAERLTAVAAFLRDDAEMDLVYLCNLTAVDRETYFELVYHLQSLDLNHLLTLKTLALDHEAPAVPSLTPLYRGAELQEREVYDLMGITFEGHPDLRRMLLWDGFPGHPLRKDFLGMPSGMQTGLPSFPHESGRNVWPVPGSAPVANETTASTEGPGG